MLIHLSRLPDVIADGRTCKENGRTYWQDIPEFSFWFSEEALHVHAIHDIDLGNCPLTWQQQAQRYKAANTFAALYLSALTPSITHEWKSIQRITRDTLTQALEVEIVSYSQIRRAGIYIPAAAQWLLHSAPLIWEFCKRKCLCSGDMEERDWIGGSDGSEALWQGEDGFRVERWVFWKERFADVARLKRKGFAGRVIDDVVMCARDAGKMMGAVEQEDAFALDGLAMVFDGDGASS
ncbi:hypothetical protein KCU81_g7084, partial [Aureobasidium melanogenum]|uniref:Uncharacterized protein n=1 Tax=Aureobasidium melanogenum (strain CBS 110374) TaxID=1043003 RepID=A0A074VUA7_AURM1